MFWWFDRYQEAAGMGNKIFGVVRDISGNGAPMGGLRVQAWDEDWPDGDDFMGQDYTDECGEFEIRYREAPGIP